MISGDLFNEKWSSDSAVQFIQQSNKSNNGSTCTTGSTWNTNSLIKITGVIAACMIVIMLQPSTELVGDGGGTTSQAISNGAMCLTVAISAVCLVFMTVLIHSVHAIGLR